MADDSLRATQRAERAQADPQPLPARERGRSWDKPLTDAERIKRQDAETARVMALEAAGQWDADGQWHKSTWNPA